MNIPASAAATSDRDPAPIRIFDAPREAWFKASSNPFFPYLLQRMDAGIAGPGPVPE